MLAHEQHEEELHATLVVSREEARNGTTRSIMLPGGRRAVVLIPSGVNNGYQIRLDSLPATRESAPEKVLLSVLIATPENTESSNRQPDDAVPAISADDSIVRIAQPVGATPPPHFISPLADQPTADLEPVFPDPQYQMARQKSAAAWVRQPPLLIIALISALVLVLILSSLVYYKGVYEPGKLHDQASATALARVKGTASVRATATAQMAATAQAQTRATATAVSGLQANYDQITHNPPTLRDTLTAPDSNNWDTGPGCSFTNGAYHTISTQKGIITPCFARASNFSNFAYQVQLSITRGDYGGVLFRANTTNLKLYLFRIGQDGSYNLDYYPDGTGVNTRILAEGSSNLILTGVKAANQITVIARGANIDLYINGKYLISVSESSQAAGQIGIIADDTQNPTEVVYSLAQVWTL
jgi:hypothetical protein